MVVMVMVVVIHIDIIEIIHLRENIIPSKCYSLLGRAIGSIHTPTRMIVPIYGSRYSRGAEVLTVTVATGATRQQVIVSSGGRLHRERSAVGIGNR